MKMLKASPINDKDVQEALCKLCSMEYDADALAYSLEEDGKAVGICQFGFKDGCGHIYGLKSADGINDPQALFMLGRAAMNFLDLTGFRKVYFDNVRDSNDAFVRALGFKRLDDGKYFLDTTGFFTQGCSEMNK